MATEARSEVARVDRDDPVLAELRRDGTARLRFSRPLIELLDDLSIELNTPVADLLTQAVGLFKVAVEAQTRGEQVCLVDKDLDIVGEIADFGSPVDLGAARFPAEDADRDEQ